MDFLEYTNGRNSSCTGSRADRNGIRTCNRNYSQDRPQKDRSISGAQPERSTGRSDSVVLPGLRQELHHLGSRDTRDLPGKAPDQITPPDNHLVISKRALLYEGLFRFSPPKTTIGDLTTRGGQWWSKVVLRQYILTSKGGRRWCNSTSRGGKK